MENISLLLSHWMELILILNNNNNKSQADGQCMEWMWLVLSTLIRWAFYVSCRTREVDDYGGRNAWRKPLAIVRCACQRHRSLDSFAASSIILYPAAALLFFSLSSSIFLLWMITNELSFLLSVVGSTPSPMFLARQTMPAVKKGHRYRRYIYKEVDRR